MISLTQFEQDGFAITKPLFSPQEVAHLLLSLTERAVDQDPRRGGTRDILDAIPSLHGVAANPTIRKLAGQVLGPNAFVVRTTLFDKTEAANWKVPWHQDVTIAVTERMDLPGYGPWSIKAGAAHVQPPSSILEHMVTIRVHLDDCPSTNGALRVMPGSHRLGKLNQNLVHTHIEESRAVSCEVSAGAALVMRPLLLHSSSAAINPGHRRVFHFDFAAADLPHGLDWRTRR